MQRHEANLIKLLAALTAAPRWVTALVIADGARFAWGEAAWWVIASACLSVLFAGVETYAASFIMRAWRSARPGSTTERVLLALWLVTLLALVVVMAPPIYANTMRVAFATLPAALIIAWSISVAASTFLIIGGVGYAERQIAAPPAISSPLPQVSVSLPELSAPAAGRLPLPRTWRKLSAAERLQVVELSVEEIKERYHVSDRTARNWRQH